MPCNFGKYAVLILVPCLLQVTIAGVISDEHRIYNDLFKEYNPNIRPVKNAAETVQIYIEFSLQHVGELDAKNQLLKIAGWLGVQWIDEYLSWDEEAYGGVDRIVVPPHKIWLPSFALDNSAGSVYDRMHYEYFRVTVYSDGYVEWEPGGNFESVCKISVKYYPFDVQKCKLVFANWVYTGRHVNMTEIANDVNLERFAGNGEWDIVKTEAKRFETLYACCPEPYPEVHFVVYFRRQSLYYITNIVVPCFILSFLELLVFIIPTESGEKISLGITIMLGFSVFTLLIDDNIPNTSEATPVIVIYLNCCMAMAAVSIIAAVFILRMHHTGSLKQPPKWLTKATCLHKNQIKTCTNMDQRNSHINLVLEPVDELDIERNGNVKNEKKESPKDKDVLNQIYEKLDMLKNVDQVQQDECFSEWKRVAHRLDWLLFWGSSILQFLMAVSTLILFPLESDFVDDE